MILNVTVASDGSAKAVTVESGPPMLRQSAISSATRSQFQANPENRTGRYRLVYRFVLDQTTKCEHDDSYPRVAHKANVVTITEQNVPICDPAIERVRSAKCPLPLEMRFQNPITVDLSAIRKLGPPSTD